MKLQSTLERYALQLKNVPRTLVNVVGVLQKMMKALHDVHFPDAENQRPGPTPDCPDIDILTTEIDIFPPERFIVVDFFVINPDGAKRGHIKDRVFLWIIEV